MLVLSLDEDEQAPRRFLEDHKLPWPPILLGAEKENSVRGAYGIAGVPTAFPIGPDGIVLARDPTPAKVSEALGDTSP